MLLARISIPYVYEYRTNWWRCGILVHQTARANESRSIPKPHLEPAVINPKTGKAERVFVNLEAVYPNADDPALEISFEELRAIKRGWAARDWRQPPAGPLRVISGNVQSSPPKPSGAKEAPVEESGVDTRQNLGLEGENSSQIQPTEAKETKPTKPRRVKVREIKQEAQTGKPTRVVS